MPHANTRLTLHGRSLLIERVVVDGRPVSHVAKELGISRQCANRWLNRHRAEGTTGLHNRWSRPRTSPRKTSADTKPLSWSPVSWIAMVRCGSQPSRRFPGDGIADPDPRRLPTTVLAGPDHRRDNPLLPGEHEPVRARSARRAGPYRREEIGPHPGRRRLARARPRSDRGPQPQEGPHRIRLRPRRHRRPLPPLAHR
ncbi:hypothetical protein E3T61_12190 [Cryobacterium lactosi]|uniref:DNA-binding domain-containing protein n=1 Tax=Cryobacterium lactosi TaxID=1259202 RepID=A0A4R9BQ83_9MICO|nr:hypothetical protein E3T61_12190 [Cryobacterium lactosi]